MVEEIAAIDTEKPVEKDALDEGEMFWDTELD